MFRFKTLQVCLKHPKEKIDIHRWLRNFKNPLVSARSEPDWRCTGICLCTGESDREGELARDQINSAQSNGELLQKPAEHEEQRLGGFDLVIELKTFLERFRRLNKFQQ